MSTGTVKKVLYCKVTERQLVHRGRPELYSKSCSFPIYAESRSMQVRNRLNTPRLLQHDIGPLQKAFASEVRQPLSKSLFYFGLQPQATSMCTVPHCCPLRAASVNCCI